ncbi:hypothetical protein [Micavibrio aeruginosavorus]|uniref:hypothetical protein n=1 Tax=Micavibrio aeruginosavorus TaxID=349221 RepID=UPI003F4A87F1
MIISQTLKFFMLGVAAIAVLSAPAFADDRMAGTPGGVNRPAVVKKEKPDATEAQKKQEQEQAQTVKFTPPATSLPKFSYKVLESYGTLSDPLGTTLGVDMWAGSSRSTIVKEIPNLPTGYTVATLQDMTLRLLLTQADSGFINGDVAPEKGNDLMTLRLQKLLDIGAYKSAMDLYTQIAGEPYHEKLARVGITSMLYSGETGLACLEFRAVQKRMMDNAADMSADDTVWWTAMAPICDAIQARMINPKADDFKIDEAALGNSKILTQLLSRKDFKLSISEAEDFAALNGLERSVLASLRRYDYNRLKLRDVAAVDGAVLMIMVEDPTMPARLRAPLMAEALRRGLVHTDRLVALYEDATIDGGPLGSVAQSWRSIKGASKATIDGTLPGLMNFDARTPVAAYYPFAESLSKASPEGFSGRALDNGLRVMMLAGVTPPERWVKAWNARESVSESLPSESYELGAAIAVSGNNSRLLDIFNGDAAKARFTTPESQKDKEILAVFSGLGTENVLHNVGAPDAYEKLFDLTAPNDYVMPSGGLLEQLGRAAEDQRLGETVLIASVILNDMARAPDKVHPGVVREVLRSLVTVGFKKEAHDLAIAVTLGLDELK